MSLIEIKLNFIHGFRLVLLLQLLIEITSFICTNMKDLLCQRPNSDRLVIFEKVLWNLLNSKKIGACNSWRIADRVREGVNVLFLVYLVIVFTEIVSQVLMNQIAPPASKLYSVSPPTSKLYNVSPRASKLYSVSPPASKLYSVSPPASRLYSVSL